jgi:exodeoxyribonuclease VII small subunit
MSKPVPSAGRTEAGRAEAAEPSKLTFEQALAELEKIVARMESGELSLEQALATHKRGLELARFCQQKLEAAQQQVKVLEGEVLKPLVSVPETETGEDR